MEWLYYAVAMLYNLVLIVTIGLTLVETYFSKGASTQFIHRQNKYRVFAVRLLFILVICSIFEQAMMWIKQFGMHKVNFSTLFFETSTGQIWIAIFSLVFIGLFIQRLSTTTIVIWGLLLLVAESLDGHISALASYMIIFDFVHLLCTAIWVGGIVTFILHWKHNKEELLPIMQSFMRVIWFTIIIMSASGIILTISILPDPLYLIYSGWGIALIIKVLLVIAALYCGYLVRNHIKEKQLPALKALLVEAIILVIVLLLAGLITAISPEPKDNTLNSHKMGDELHYTVELSPNRPGPNTLTLTLWTLEHEGEIDQVQVKLIDEQKGERTARDFELTEVDLVNPYNFNGFIESRYTLNESLRLPYPSDWQQEVTITFKNGLERSFITKFKN